ncbi:MAG: DUF1565 domain-containing protein [Chloroflexi bacterium]|nr:DUF1565 domain-containing protein [Chloroflexota bacterium]
MSRTRIISKTILFVIVVTFASLFFPRSAQSAQSYYVSPTGLDSNLGTATSNPWKTFAKAWTVLQPGDTLYLMDGEYKQVLEPTISGTSGNPITIKALNDGKAIINGEGVRSAVVIGKIWDLVVHTRDTTNPYGNYINVEGIVAKNSNMDVYQIYSRNVNLRRCSGYNANTHDNYHVITIWSLGTPANPANVLVEDCVAAGSGRKMIVAYDTYVNVVLRRNFVAWQTWQGDLFCQPRWPQTDGIELYPAAHEDQPDVLNNSIFENNINFGLTANTGIDMSPNPGMRAGNKFLGNISLGTGMRWEPTDPDPVKFVPAPITMTPCSYNGVAMPASCATQSQCNAFGNSTTYRGGMVVGALSSPQILKNNLFQDTFSAYNGSLGLVAGAWGTGTTNNRLINATMVNNDIGAAPLPVGVPAGTDTTLADLNRFSLVQNLRIGKMLTGESNPAPGNGATVQYRYVDGVLTNQPLWPWPMEERIRREFADPTLFQVDGIQGHVWSNFSVTNSVCGILAQHGAANCAMTYWKILLPLILR